MSVLLGVVSSARFSQSFVVPVVLLVLHWLKKSTIFVAGLFLVRVMFLSHCSFMVDVVYTGSWWCFIPSSNIANKRPPFAPGFVMGVVVGACCRGDRVLWVVIVGSCDFP